MRGGRRRGRLKKALAYGVGWLSTALGEPTLRRYRPATNLVLPVHGVDRARLPAIDFHNHLGKWHRESGGWIAPDVSRLLDTMEECNLELMVNLDGGWGDELEENLDRYDRPYPGRFATFCRLDWRLLRRDRGLRILLQSLERSARAGAVGLKVWKDLGLGVKARDGRLVLPDDPQLGELWEAAGGLGLPVVIHTADPVAFFQPVDLHNERLEDLLAWPEESCADRGLPSFDRLMDALETVVARHPRTTFVGAHVGCYAENLAWVGRLLSSYENFNIDLAARMSELGRQPRATRVLMADHVDRVLFGTDAYPPRAEDFRIWFRFLETDDECFAYAPEDRHPPARWQISGLGLGDDELRRIYRGNALRLLPQLARR